MQKYYTNHRKDSYILETTNEYIDQNYSHYMLSVGDSSQPDNSGSVKDGACFIEDTSNQRRDGSSSYSAILPGKGNNSILIYGPLAMAEEIAGMLRKNRMGAELYTSEEELKVRDLLEERDYDLFIYHASKRESFKGLRSERMPTSLEAVLLGYGVGCGYQEKIIRQCKDEFEVRLLERLKRE